MIKQTALAVAAIAAGVSAQAAEAAKSDLSVTVDVTYVSDYVFRGTKLADASVQPSVEAAYADFYLGAWHTDGISDSTGSETDFYAGYGLKLNDTVKLDAGVTQYTYNGGSGNDSTEVYVGAAADVLLSPSLYAYYDFDYENTTVEASIGYSFPIDAIKASLDLSGKVGFVDLGDEDSRSLVEDNYTYFVAGVAVPFKLSETATLTVGGEYIYNNEDTISAFKSGSTEHDILVGKVGISIGF